MIVAPKKRVLAEAAKMLRGIATLPTLPSRTRALPRGGGETVMVVPGFRTSDRSTVVLRAFLERKGYRAVGWELGFNHGRVEELVPRLAERIQTLAERSGRPIKIVGWSMGGFLTREATRLAPEHVEQIITMGTPVIGGPKYTQAAAAFRERGADLDELEREVAAMNASPLPVPITALYSERDSLVAWQACIDDNPHNRVRYVEVDVGHFELGFSAPVFRIVAQALASKG